MNVAVAHLIPAPFTQQVGRALEEAEMLDSFLCTLVDQPDRAWQRLAKRASKLVRFDLEKNLKRRAITEVPASRVRTFPAREATRMLLGKFIKDPVLGDRIFHWGRDGFDEWVSRQLDGLDAIYGYEYGSLRSFEVAQSQGIRTIYDLPSPEHDFVEQILAPEFERFPEMVTPYRKLVIERQQERTERRQKEWELADLVVSNSNFTADSWRAAGWSEKSVAVVPYGAPPITTLPERLGTRAPLRFLWAGTFSIRKGAHYLVNAIRSLSAAERSAFTVDVYGAVTLPEVLLARVPEEVRFKGSLPRSQLFEEMRKSDLLVFPTLCDGFGLVANEAFAHGLPVLTTRRAGAADLVKEGENGWLIPAGDSAAIAEALRRAVDEKDQLAEMRSIAQQTAAEWQWSDYRREIACATRKMLSSS